MSTMNETPITSFEDGFKCMCGGDGCDGGHGEAHDTVMKWRTQAEQYYSNGPAVISLIEHFDFVCRHAGIARSEKFPEEVAAAIKQVHAMTAQIVALRDSLKIACTAYEDTKAERDEARAERDRAQDERDAAHQIRIEQTRTHAWAQCRCGWVGETRETVADANDDGMRHFYADRYIAESYGS